jgi:hypothetical protein
VAFREVRVNEVREVVRCWCVGDGLRTAAERAGVDRKTARRYVEAAQAAGLIRENGVGQQSDELIGAVIAAVRPARASGHGAAWDVLLAHEAQIRDWVGRDELQLTNVHGKLTRRGWCPIARCTGSRPSGAGSAAGSPRCGSPTGSPGSSASSTSPASG